MISTQSSEKFKHIPGAYDMNSRSKLICNVSTLLTSNDVPMNNKSRSSSIHIVGTGTTLGSNLQYSVQGFDNPTFCP